MMTYLEFTSERALGVKEKQLNHIRNIFPPEAITWGKHYFSFSGHDSVTRPLDIIVCTSQTIGCYGKIMLITLNRCSPGD